MKVIDSINKHFLKFNQPKYIEFIEDHKTKSAQMCLWLILIIYPSWILFDYILLPQYWQEPIFLGTRLSTAFISLLWLKSPIKNKMPFSYFIPVSGLNLGIAFMMPYTMDSMPLYFIGNGVASLAISLILIEKISILLGYYSVILVSNLIACTVFSDLSLFDIFYQNGGISFITLWVVSVGFIFLKQNLFLINYNLVEKLKNSKTELEHKNKSLKAMFENVPIGICNLHKSNDTINPEFLISSEYSAKMSDLTKRNKLEGKNIFDVLFKDSNIGEENASITYQCLLSAMNEDILSFEINEEKLIREITVIIENEIKILELQWKPIIDSKNVIVSMMLLVKDITKLKKLEQHSKAKSLEVELLMEMTSQPINKMLFFINKLDEEIEQCQNIIKNIKEDSIEETVNKIKMYQHTIKGNSRSLNLNKLSSLIHSEETKLSELEGCDIKETELFIRSSIEKIRQMKNLYESVINKFFGRKFNNTNTITVKKDKILDVCSYIKQELEPKKCQINREVLEKIYLKVLSIDATTIRSVLEDCHANVELAAREHNKPLPKLTIDDSGVLIAKELEPILKDVFIHLLTNAVAHSLESHSFTENNDLNPYIKTTIKESNKSIEITLEDSGKGYNAKKIYDVALAKGIIETEKFVLSKIELVNLVFHPNFSTAESITEVSGRGVGMDAVKSIISENGGNIFIAPEEIMDASSDCHFVKAKTVIQLPKNVKIA